LLAHPIPQIWPKGCKKAVVESNNYVFILLIYFVTFVPIEDVKISAMDVKKIKITSNAPKLGSQT
jgi:hypothetical protein